MKKVVFLILFFTLLCVAYEVFAAQQAYIVKVEYSIDDSSFGPYNSGTGRGVIAWIDDINGPTPGGKIYKVASGVPYRSYVGHNVTGTYSFSYQNNRIAQVNTTQHERIYTRYTVKNTGTVPIESLRATHGSDAIWGTEWGNRGWKTWGGYIRRLGYLNPGETKYEIYYSKIKNFPMGYCWKPIVLGWPDGSYMSTERCGYKAVFYAQGPDFSPPDIDCSSLDPQKIEYGGTYSHTCTYENSSAQTVYLYLEESSSSRLYGTWGARYGDAVFYHYFGKNIISIPPGTLDRPTAISIDDNFSTERTVNLSYVTKSIYHDFCLDSSCSSKAPVFRADYPRIGYGPGKYLGIKDPEAFSETVIGENGRPAYEVYFDLYNPNASYWHNYFGINESVLGTDYDIDIQILEEGGYWRKDGSTAVRKYTFSVNELEQKEGISDVFPGFFDKNDSTVYPFFYVIPNLDEGDLLPRVYQLYITTIWKNHPRTGVDEPIDQVIRSFAPGLDLELEDINVGGSQTSITTYNNYIWNFSSFPLEIEIKLNDNVDDFSIVTSLPIKFTLNPLEKVAFEANFSYSGSAPSEDMIGDLIGNSFFNVSGNFISSDVANSKIFISKSSPPTAFNLSVTDPNPEYCGIIAYPPVRVNWEFSDPGDTQKSYKIEVSKEPDFHPPEVQTGTILSESQSYVFTQPGKRLDWHTTYYWRLEVTDSGSNSSGWIEGDPFITTHPWPEPDFSWLPIKPTAEELISFTDLSVFHDSSQGWLWDFGDEQFSTEQNPSHSYFYYGPYVVTLTATDGDGYYCSKSQSLNVDFPLPGWKEISPF